MMENLCSFKEETQIQSYTIIFTIEEGFRKEQLRKLSKNSLLNIVGCTSVIHNNTQIKIQVFPEITVWDLKVHYYDYIEETEGLDPLNISLFLLPDNEELQVCSYFPSIPIPRSIILISQIEKKLE